MRVLMSREAGGDRTRYLTPGPGSRLKSVEPRYNRSLKVTTFYIDRLLIALTLPGFILYH